jgi:hypothetical protein
MPVILRGEQDASQVIDYSLRRSLIQHPISHQKALQTLRVEKTSATPQDGAASVLAHFSTALPLIGLGSPP